MTTTSKLFGTAVAAAVLFATAPTFAQDALEVSFADAEWTIRTKPISP